MVGVAKLVDSRKKAAGNAISNSAGNGALDADQQSSG